MRRIPSTAADGAAWRIAANFPHQITFQKEETCGIAAAAAIAGFCRT